jgi:uncharacterized protein YacL
MSIRVFGTGLVKITFSPLEKPETEMKVASNVGKISAWGMLATAAIAVISTIYSRHVIEEAGKTFALAILKASLASCATYTIIASVLAYKAFKKTELLNRNMALFERNLVLLTTTGFAIGLVCSFLGKNHPLSSIGSSLIYRSLFSLCTVFPVWRYHIDQMIRLNKPIQDRLNFVSPD